MTFPGNDSTGSTLINDLQALVDWIVFHGVLALYLIALLLPILLLARALINERKKHHEHHDQRPPK